jgi:hypothetical protein
LGLQDNEQAIMDAYKNNGSRTGLKGVTIGIKNETGLIDSIENVEVIFCPGPPKNSAIEFNIKAKRKKKKFTEEYNFDLNYQSEEPVEMEFNDVSDYQVKKGIFYLKPEDSEYTLFFDVKTKII